MKKLFMNIRGPSKNLSIAILGPGAIGGLMAAVLWKNDFSVTCITKPDETETLNKKGIHVISKIFGDFVAHPKIISKLDFHPDILFITTKVNALSKPLGSIPTVLLHKSIVIPLLNGFEHIKLLREYIGKRVAVGMIGKIESQKTGLNSIIHTTKLVPQIEIASDSDIPQKSLKKIVDALNSIGIKTEILNSEAEVVWRKLARLNAIACITAVTNRPLGFARNNKKWREKLENCIKEGISIARAEGVDLDKQEVMRQIYALPQDLTTSLQRDIANGIDSELEAIPGAVLRRAKHHGLICPTIAEIYQTLTDRVSLKC